MIKLYIEFPCKKGTHSYSIFGRTPHTRKGINNMKRNKQNDSQGYGYPQQNGYPQQGGYPQQNGYPQQGVYPQQGTAYQGYTAPQGYAQQAQPQGYPQQTQMQGYAQQAQSGYTQGQLFQAGRNYQTPQVAETQQGSGARENAGTFAGQAPYAQAGYQQTGYQPYGQAPTGYAGASYTQQTGYQPNAGTAPAGYGYSRNQAPAGSYIPQTPYSQGYTTPGYQAQPNPNYAQGYTYNNQMGRSSQKPFFQNQDNVPLNGGGYVPQQGPVRKQPFVLTDLHLLIVSAVLLGLFALGMFVGGLSILKWVFVALALGTIALLWVKPMTDTNKRLCYSVVFGILALVTVIGAVTAGAGGRDDTRQANPSQGAAQSQAQAAGTELPGLEAALTPAPATPTPIADNSADIKERLKQFMQYWAANEMDKMLSLCSPTWASKQENSRQSLFQVTANRTPTDYRFGEVSGTPADTSRTVIMEVKIDKHNTKDPVLNLMSVIMVQDYDGQWYVDPNSIQSNEVTPTPDASITATPAPITTPETNPNTILYYNTDGGSKYHRDPNCKTTHKKYLPMQGQFYFSQVNDDPYNKLEPCHICLAPDRYLLNP